MGRHGLVAEWGHVRGMHAQASAGWELAGCSAAPGGMQQPAHSGSSPPAHPPTVQQRNVLEQRVQDIFLVHHLQGRRPQGCRPLRLK